MAEQKKEPHFISKRLLKALGGKKKQVQLGAGEPVDLVGEGAYLWGIEDREKGRGILRHSLLVSRVAYYLGKEFKEKEIKGYENIDLQHIVHAGLLHDSDKLLAESREEMPREVKEYLGIPPDFQESSSDADEVVVSWLKDLGFPPEVYEAIKNHNFPQEVINNPYWKITLIADYMASQQVMPIEERLTNVKTRWIDQRLAEGKAPRVTPKRFELAAKNIRAVAKEIFGALGTSDREFIRKHKLNSDESQTRWEKFLLKTMETLKEDRAKRLVEVFLGGSVESSEK